MLSRQCGVAATDQLVAAGVARPLLDRAVADGFLERRGPRLLVDPRWSSGGDNKADWKRQLFMAFYGCAPRQRATAAVFRRSAACLWGLDGITTPNGSPPVEIAVSMGRRPAGKLFLVRPFGLDERSELEGLPVTSVTRTLMDLGQVAGKDVLERALESALRRHYVTVGDLSTALGQVHRLPGTNALRSLIADRPAGLPPTESDAETLFVQLARRAGLPPPRRQFCVRTAEGTFRTDFAWPLVRIAVEIDGAATHASARALTRDLRRQNAVVVALAAAGWILLRFTWYDLAAEPYAGQSAAKLLEAWSIGLARTR